ncbi:MAG: TVP38/TMEM64 family protein [Cyanobacteriota bacterium]|nr:TVP38/TMEM64 family protein [Cyanobacteriota bacterium]
MNDSPPPTETTDTKPKKQGKDKLKTIAIIIAAVALLIIAQQFFDIQQRLIDALNWIRDLGAIGPVVFIIIYILAAVLFIPGSLLTLGAGFIYGVIKGSIFVSIASTLGATLAFIVGRYFARSWVSKQIEGKQKFKAIDEAVAEEGWKIVGLTRLSPIFPFNLLNYAFGVTQVSLRDYVVASWIGMMPGTVMYVYFGSLAESLATLGQGEKTPLQWALFGVGLLATFALTFYVTKIAREALDRKIS